MTMKELAKGFGESTSMHGLGRAVGSTCWAKRLVWSILIWGATAMAIYNLTAVFQEFTNYKTITEQTVEYKPSLDFPSVTICNLNRIRKSKLPANLTTILDAYSSFEVDEQREEIDLYLRLLTDQELQDLGHDLKSMLIDCSFNRLPCTTANFSVHFNMELGNCYTFNKAQEDVDFAVTEVSGPANGLILQLNIEQLEYLQIRPTAGAIVLVHAPGTMGFPDEMGLQVAPGFSTSVGLKRMEVERTPPPYGDCIDGPSVNEDASMNMFAMQYQVRYTDTACKKSCYQMEVFKSCLCCDSGYPCEDDSLTKYHKSNLTFVPYCNTSDPFSKQSRCLLEIQERYIRGNLPCIGKCQPACSETNFRQTVSSSKWPSDAHLGIIAHREQRAARTQYGHSNSVGDANNTNPNISSDFVESNLLRVVVFYEEMNYEKIKSSPAYDWSRLLSDIGGQLGLWMGFSLMTGVEFLELIVDGIILACKKAFGKQPKTKTSQDPNAVITMTSTDCY